MKDKVIEQAFWVCTDSDTMQWRRLAPEKGESVYEMYQVNQYGSDLFHVAHGFLYPNDYAVDQNEELLTVYGWPQETIKSSEFPALMAEAVFESSAPEYDTEEEFNYFEEAAKVICKTIGVNINEYL